VVGQLDDTHLPTMARNGPPCQARLVRDREEAESGPHMLTAGTEDPVPAVGGLFSRRNR
jgi:hypothetical protein